MKKHSLKVNNGLSMSQAQSISNLCNQRAEEINQEISFINNFSKSVRTYENHIIQKGRPMPENIIDMLETKAKLHACQAFLMENIKAKNALLNDARFDSADVSGVEKPVKGDYLDIDDVLLEQVNEDFGWEQLSSEDYNEYLEAEAYASHIGQFIHKNGKLALLKQELPLIPDIEWMEIEKDKKVPVTINIHHTSKELFDLHEKLAKLHRVYEQKVNFYKSKVKNIVTEENARIAKHNNDLVNKKELHDQEVDNIYYKSLEEYNKKVSSIKSQFEIDRQEKIKEIASMRIFVDNRFKEVVDMFMESVKE